MQFQTRYVERSGRSGRSGFYRQFDRLRILRNADDKRQTISFGRKRLGRFGIDLNLNRLSFQNLEVTGKREVQKQVMSGLLLFDRGVELYELPDKFEIARNLVIGADLNVGLQISGLDRKSVV